MEARQAEDSWKRGEAFNFQQRKDTIFYISRAAQNSIFQHLPFNFARHSQRAGLHFVIYNSLYIKQAKKPKT